VPDNLALQGTQASGVASCLRPWAPALSSFAVAKAYEMKFDVYGRFELEVLRENNGWIAYRTSIGMRSRDSSVIIPASLAPEEIAGYLDDVLHELCVPGRAIRVLG
jgi:hypothetical protein